MRYILTALLFAMSLMSGIAHAATTISNVNCRSQPRPTASVIARLSAGTDVAVQRRTGSWSLVRRSPHNCWMATRYLSDESTADANRTSLQQTRASAQRTRAATRRFSRPGRRSSAWSSIPVRSPRRMSRPRRSSGYGTEGSCPCSGSNVCIGPRGGRFCITSGGNKRYGV